MDEDRRRILVDQYEADLRESLVREAEIRRQMSLEPDDPDRNRHLIYDDIRGIAATMLKTEAIHQGTLRRKIKMLDSMGESYVKPV